MRRPRSAAQASLPLFPAPKPPLAVVLPYDAEKAGAELAAFLTAEGIGRAPLAVRLGVSLAAVRGLLAGVGDIDAAWEAARALHAEQWSARAPTLSPARPCGFCGHVHRLGTCPP